MRAGQDLTQSIEFTVGQPDGDITWTLLNGRGITVATGSVTPAADALSAVIVVPGADNDISEAGAMAEPRELQWNYTAGGLIRRGRYRYRLEAFLPFGVAETGVRHKLGIEDSELEDESIDLVTAYGWFRDQVTQAKLDAADSFAALAACDAIEARAASTALPLMQVKLAQKEASGTDQFQRQDVDWSLIQAQLDRYIAAGIAAVNPDANLTASFGSLLILATRDDPVTGAAG